ncbi:hypothetical protein C8J57DRAFT_1267624 [Mycena rebaudengoi]|nr:hypothetical protein C8J57DRAFT_1267624 [Mycena rebaudengoi]
MDDDDDFLYGGGIPQPQMTPIPVSQSTSLEDLPSELVAHLEAQAAAEASESQTTEPAGNEAEDDEEAVDLGDETEDDEEDVEIIMEPQSRSLDFRQPSSARPSSLRTASSTAAGGSAAAIRAPQPTLTTEYTPIQRAGAAPPSTTPSRTASLAQVAPQPTPQPPPSSSEPPPAAPPAAPQTQPPPQSEDAPLVDDGVDPTTLPPAPAPPSHPDIDPNAMGMVDGRPIIDVDLSSLAEKQWRRPGSDISDWFNYGFDELSWEAYCYRRRDLGELANVLKTNVLNFSNLPEDQLTALPPEVRQMVMTGTTAMMNTAANPGMMGPGVMMDMSGMMGPMGMGMNGDMGMNGAMMQGMMQDGGQGQVGNGATGTPEQGGMMQEGAFNNGAGMMGMGMEYMQEQNQMAQQQMYNPQMEAPQPVPPTGPLGRGAPASFRGRAMRSRGFPRGRGRGGYVGDGVPPPPVRPTSPLPPNVPTGPRNQNKYKDRDNNAPALDGLDYGGTNKEGRTTSGEPEERSRKRRSSPNLDEGRGSKRR